MGDKPDSYTGTSLCVMTTSTEDRRIPHMKIAEWGVIKINPAMYLKSAGRLI